MEKVDATLARLEDKETAAANVQATQSHRTAEILNRATGSIEKLDATVQEIDRKMELGRQRCICETPVDPMRAPFGYEGRR